MGLLWRRPIRKERGVGLDGTGWRGGFLRLPQCGRVACWQTTTGRRNATAESKRRLLAPLGGPFGRAFDNLAICGEAGVQGDEAGPGGVAWRKRQQALRSDWLNSYGTVHPMDPNLRRSCVTLRHARGWAWCRCVCVSALRA